MHLHRDCFQTVKKPLLFENLTGEALALCKSDRPETPVIFVYCRARN